MDTDHSLFIDYNLLYYRKHFVVPSNWKGSSIHLQFDGVFHFTMIWVNGQFVGNHTAGYTGFTVRLDNISSLSYGGKNVISLRTGNSCTLNPTELTSMLIFYLTVVDDDFATLDATYGSGHWYEGGGIYREVYIVRQNSAHFVADGIFVDPEWNGTHTTACAEMEVFDNSLWGVEFTTRFTLIDTVSGSILTSSSAPITAGPGTSLGKATLDLSGVEPWSLQSPQLYEVTAELMDASGDVQDAFNVSVAFRSTHFDGSSGFSLNGNHIRFRGFSHHNSMGGLGVAIPPRVYLFKVQAR